ncbi:MAG: family 78 glycoside hydrolase catalytic domain [Marinilabiliaceae bacterium]|nr:family 78 glycoside hydrolase catalytic domain [Marinilabiliaceae bacterium]
MMLRGITILFFVFATIMFWGFRDKKVNNTDVVNLKTEMMVNPLGLNTATPRFSWQIKDSLRGVMQVSYQILVASSLEKLNNNIGDLWDSKDTPGDISVLVPYLGSKLKSKTFAYWKVKVVTNKRSEVWSKPAFFSIGLLHKKDWHGRWIGIDKAFEWDNETAESRLSARYLRTGFKSDKEIKRATAYIIGLGMYELYLNGRKIGDQVLAPVPTDYTKTIVYNTFDVTNNIVDGENAIGVVLGNGRFYTMRQNYKPYKIKNFGYPKLLFQLEIDYADGSHQTIVSNDKWKMTTDGPIRSNNEYDGEIYDATKELTVWNTIEYNDESWFNARYVQEPGGMPVGLTTPNMKILKEIQPVSIHHLSDGKYILDMGQNFAGWLQLKVKGNRGDTITLRFAESLNDDGSLFTANLRGALCTDKYILKGGDVEVWEPSFVYHGFRYVEISGFSGTPSVNDFKGKLVGDEVETVGSLETSNKTVNQIVKNAWWGIVSNYKGMPVDCPQRDERQPWLADHQVVSFSESFLFNNATLYAKWLDDIQQSQNADGSLPDVAPAYWNYYSDNMTWPGTYLIIADMLYSQYGDIQSVKKHYGAMKKWLSYMEDRYMNDQYIITKDSYGDWCIPPATIEEGRGKNANVKHPSALISTAYHYYFLNLMQKFASLSGNTTDIEGFKTLADSVNVGFHKVFFNEKSKSYGDNLVTENILPLAFGMVSEKNIDGVFKNVTELLVRHKLSHVTTGVIGTSWLMKTLNENGRSDVAYRLASNTDYPSWGYMVENGATTIWELWNGNTAHPKMNSQNHVMMLGDLLVWMFRNMAGIQSDSAAYKSIVLKPEDIEGLNHVNATYNSVYGPITSNFTKTLHDFNWNVTIPANTTAYVYIPVKAGATITEGGKDIKLLSDIKYIETKDRYAICKVGSGTYSFKAQYNWRNAIVVDEFIYERADFPECHGSTIAETPGGLVASWFGGTKERNPDCSIYVSRMVNNKWTAPVKVVDGIKNDTLRYALWNPVLYQVPDGELILFYKEGTHVSAWVGKYITSNDNGISWSKPKDLNEGFLGPVKNKPVLLSNGTLICPSSSEHDGWRVHFETTNDFGKIWNMVGPINDGKEIKAIQPSVLVHKDGRLQIICRSRNRALLQSWSSDNGKTWCELTKTNLPNNNSGTDAVSLKDGRQLLVYNHVLPPGNLVKGPRTPLHVSTSKDGINWNACLVLENSPISQYSYPSVIQGEDGMIHIVYTWRRERIKYVKVDPKKLKGIAIIEGLWPEYKK